MKQYVVFTVMVGSYGNIYQPKYIDERFDYVLFSNDYKELSIGVWKICPFPIPEEIKPNDNKRISRYPKCHPEILLADYKASLYVDANVQIVDKWVYDRIIELDENKVDYAGVKLQLSGRDCIYRHAFDICVRSIAHDYEVIQQMHQLRSEGFPEHYGLNENNVIFRRHNENIKAIDSLWWEQIVKYSFRDQFSLMYCLWKHNAPLNYFLPNRTDARNSEHFVTINHDCNKNVYTQKILNLDVFEKIRNKYRTLNDYNKRFYCNLWLLLSKMPASKFWLLFFGTISSVIWLPLIVFQYIIRRISKKDDRMQ